MVSELGSNKTTLKSSPFSLSLKQSDFLGESSSLLVTNFITKDELTIFNFLSTLKLKSTNYLGWKTQIEALLHSLDIFQFIDESCFPPGPMIVDDNKITPYLDYPKWFR